MAPRLSVVRGDLAAQRADALVSTITPALRRGAGSDAAAVWARAGPLLAAACRGLRAEPGRRRLVPGAVVVTTAGALDADWVIHTVVPAYSWSDDRTHLLSRAYRGVLGAADDLGARGLVLPLLGAGVYAWPVEEAVRIALHTLGATPTRVRTTRFCVADVAAAQAVAEALARG